MAEDAPFRRAFDAARDPLTARNALGIVGTGGGGSGFITAVTPPLQVTGTTLSIDLSAYSTTAQIAAAYQPLDADLTQLAALTGTNTIYYRSAGGWAAVNISTGLAFSGGNLSSTVTAGAPVGAEYITSTADATLTNERVLTDTATVTWDRTTAGQIKANAAGGGGTPGGANTQVQFNNSSAFGGSANFVWNNATSVLTVTGQIAINAGSATSVLAGGVVESAGFKQTGTLAVLGPASSGNVALRPTGIASATGQLLLAASGAVTVAGPINLPADPTTALQAATKQYVDAARSTGPPQGRLTLQTGTPVMTTTQSAKNTLFYSPYVGDRVALYNGASFTMTTFAELSMLTTDTSKNPAAVGAGLCYDLFVWSDAGTLRLSHGPPWSSDTTRSAGTALVRVGGLWLNNASITNACAAQRGTYVGTIWSASDALLYWIYGLSSAPATSGQFMIWNAYNRVKVWSHSGYSGTGATYSGGWRSMLGDSNLRHYFVSGLAEDGFEAQVSMSSSPAPASYAACAIGYDTTATPTGLYQWTYNNSGGGMVLYTEGRFGTTALGKHYFQALDWTSSGAPYIYGGGDGGGVMPGISFSAMM